MPVTFGTVAEVFTASGATPISDSDEASTCCTNGAATVLPYTDGTCGSSTTIRQTNCGSDTGAKPMNEAIRRVLDTVPSSLYFCDVPVLPPTVYP